MQIQRLSWTKFAEHQKGIQWAIIPVGAVEAYGPHLPLGTDGLVAERLAELVALEFPAFITPLIPVGYSSTFLEYPGTLSVSPNSLQNYLLDVANCLVHHGIKKILFLNGHAGNVQSIGYVMEELQSQHNVFCIQIDIWRFLRPFAEGVVDDIEQAMGHASELMTSVMLYLMPELVQKEAIPSKTPSVTKKQLGVITVQRLNPRINSAVSGNPQAASAEKGRKIVQAGVNALIELMHHYK